MIHYLILLCSRIYQSFFYGRSQHVKAIDTKLSDTNYPFY